MAEEKTELLSEDAIEPSESNVEQYEEMAVSKRIIEFEEDQKDAKYDKLKAPEIHKRQCCRPTTHADKIISAVYILSILTAIAMTIFYFATDDNTAKFLSLIIVCVTIWLGAVVAIIAINKGFTTKSQTDELFKQNEAYYNQLKELSKQRGDLLNHLKQTNNNAKVLCGEQIKLNDSVEQFGDLMHEFNKLKESFGDSFKNIFNEMNNSQSILKAIQSQNDRAKLYAAFYEVSKRDREEGLSSSEYDRFLDKICEKYRKKFEELNLSFEAIDKDGNKTISKYEFESAVQQVLDALQLHVDEP